MKGPKSPQKARERALSGKCLVREDWMVVCAVGYEPVSASKFPNNWENKWEFHITGHNFANPALVHAQISVAYTEIPDAPEMGISLAYLGSYRLREPVDALFISFLRRTEIMGHAGRSSDD